MMRGYGYGYHMPGAYGGLGALMMFAFGVLVIAAIVLLVVWAVKASQGHGTSAGAPPVTGPAAGPGAAGHDEAVAIAKRRLASGEITPDEYAEIIRVLGG